MKTQSRKNWAVYFIYNGIHTSVLSAQFSPSVMSNTLWPMDCSTPGFPVHHQLLELAQTHVHQWCHLTISSSVIPFSSCLQSLWPGQKESWHNILTLVHHTPRYGFTWSSCRPRRSAGDVLSISTVCKHSLGKIGQLSVIHRVYSTDIYSGSTMCQGHHSLTESLGNKRAHNSLMEGEILRQRINR